MFAAQFVRIVRTRVIISRMKCYWRTTVIEGLGEILVKDYVDENVWNNVVKIIKSQVEV